MKERFLAVYDYGTGGVWCYVYARSAEEITAKYPSLAVVAERPEWMTDQHVPGDDMTFDIDDEPTGWIALVAEPQKGD